MTPAQLNDWLYVNFRTGGTRSAAIQKISEWGRQLLSDNWGPVDAAIHMRQEIAKWLTSNGFESAAPMIMELPIPNFKKMR